jgi:hypothetical protein
VARFGPWKDDEQLLIAELGSDTLQFLSPEAQQAYLLNLDRALRRQPAEVIAIVDAYGVWELVCKLVDSGPALSDELTELERYCRKVAQEL